MSGAPQFRRFVALGDSTTEGLDDPYPDGSSYRGWADMLAARLGAENPDLGYANLAIRGRKVPSIHAEQLEPALALDPDLASFLGGVNDILRPRIDELLVGDLIEEIVSSLRAGGATVLMFTYPDLRQLLSVAPRRVMDRIGRLNDRLREIAAAHGAVLGDLERRGVDHPALWSSDRLHASPLGHLRIADVAAEALGLGTIDPDWEGGLPNPVRRGRLRAGLAGATWAGSHLAPWVGRRLRGVSSGDGIEPKRPELAPPPQPSEQL